MRGVGKYIPFGSDLLKDVSGKEVTGVHRVPEILKYMEREGNIPWLPDLDAVMKSYIPIAEFKMAHQPALNRWKPFIDTTRQQGLKNGLNRWLEENFYKRPPGAWQQLLNGVVNFEYLRLLSLNGPPGFKHIMKELGTLSEYGPVDMSKGVALAAKAPIQLAKEKLGLKGKNAELNLIRAYVNLRNIVRVGDEMPGFNAAMTRTKAIFGNPITTVELADNGVSVLSTISAGYKRGVDPLTIHYKMWNTLMSVNFRGFLDQPLFQKIPTVRGLTMFMMTPLKLAEYKLDLAKNAAKDIYSTVRGQGGVKDAFGTHWTTKAMRMLVAIGLGEAIAQHYFNTSIIHITAGHWGPFSNLVEGKKEGFPIGIGDIQIQSESPVVQAASRMHKDFFTPQGQKKFWLSELKSPTASRIWNIKESSIPEDVTVGPYTIPVHDIAKWMGVKKGKMPKQYESPAKYELGLPKLGTSYRKAKSSLGSLH